MNFRPTENIAAVRGRPDVCHGRAGEILSQFAALANDDDFVFEDCGIEIFVFVENVADGIRSNRPGRMKVYPRGSHRTRGSKWYFLWSKNHMAGVSGVELPIFLQR